jgi:hypothetical protein
MENEMPRPVAGPCGLLITDLKAKSYPALPYIPEKASTHSIWLGREIMCSGVIGYEHENVAVNAEGEQPERVFYHKAKEFFTGRKRASLKYSGPKLVQAHGTVLYCLAKHAAGKRPGDEVVIETRAFLEELGKGWSPDHTHSRRKLWGVLLDLTKAHFTTSYVTEKERVKGAGTILSHATEYTPLPGEHGPISRIVVSFSITGLEIFRSRPVRLSLAKRSQLKEGFETWIYTVLRAAFARQEIRYDFLYKIAGLTKINDPKKEAGRRKEFVRRVKAALRKMTTPQEGCKNGLFHAVHYTSRGFFLFKQAPTEKDFLEMWNHSKHS